MSSLARELGKTRLTGSGAVASDASADSPDSLWAATLGGRPERVLGEGAWAGFPIGTGEGPRERR